MTSNESWPAVGIDISKCKFDAALLRPEGKVRHRTLPNTTKGAEQVCAWLAHYQVHKARIVMEATGGYGDALLEHLCAEGHHVSKVNPSQVKHFAAAQLCRNKNDRVDARVIAHYAEKMKPAQTFPPSPVQKRLRQLQGDRRLVVNCLRQVKNRRHTQPDSESLARLQATHKAEIKALEEAIRSLVKETPELAEMVALITQIKGVAEVTAITIVTRIDFDRFDNVKQFTAFLGLTPRQRTSGSSIRGCTRLSKAGDPELHSLLYSVCTECPAFQSACSALLRTMGEPGPDR